MPSTKLVIGLTGGIGSGKSTVAGYFTDYGIDIIDTDQIARDLTQPGKPAFEEISKLFKTDNIIEDGSLNRKALRKIIFADAEKRLWLEQLLHPLIRDEMNRQIDLSKSPYCIVVIPLLFESGPYPTISRALVVDAPVELQMERAGARDTQAVIEIEEIIQTQIGREQRMARADDIIFNDKGPENLIPQIEKLHKFYLSISG